MKILHVIPTFYPAVYWGGPISTTLSLCNSLNKIDDINLSVLTTNAAGPDKDNNITPAEILRANIPFDIRYCHRNAGHSISLELLQSLKTKVKWADLVHLTAVYSFPTIPTLTLTRLFKKPVVLSPHGALQRWQGTTKPCLKHFWETLCRKIVNQNSFCIHITSSMEEIASRKIYPNYYHRLIPNGVEINKINGSHHQIRSKLLRIIFIGRLHPIKGIENLLKALGNLKDVNYNLVIGGSGDLEYIESLKKLSRNLKINGRLQFSGHLLEDERKKALSNSDICIVPSYIENFGMVVAEALACGVPVICSKGAPWADLETLGCGLWTDNDPHSLARAIRKIMTMDLVAMGKRGKQWMVKEFSWSTIAKSMFDLYREMISRQVQ